MNPLMNLLLLLMINGVWGQNTTSKPIVISSVQPTTITTIAIVTTIPSSKPASSGGPSSASGPTTVQSSVVPPSPIYTQVVTVITSPGDPVGKTVTMSVLVPPSNLPTPTGDTSGNSTGGTPVSGGAIVGIIIGIIIVLFASGIYIFRRLNLQKSTKFKARLNPDQLDDFGGNFTPEGVSRLESPSNMSGSAGRKTPTVVMVDSLKKPVPVRPDSSYQPVMNPYYGSSDRQAHAAVDPHYGGDMYQDPNTGAFVPMQPTQPVDQSYATVDQYANYGAQGYGDVDYSAGHNGQQGYTEVDYGVVPDSQQGYPEDDYGYNYPVQNNPRQYPEPSPSNVNIYNQRQ
ncbi:hypothetical protein BC833DRAFT_600812 [Globomyces pollinis-pini]|nr:hypothetical protein BC833DRAFT_600812 [Globomyces pollinis-pini]